ncbi:hypothetical protein XBJ2_440032 [Xenorhabdus bovienii str. Jollieti]|uniref:Uncharacterized protein n=1 Tax=Xenorhabdus bovienii (strain SS-2004) TaxID=406818 RepID=D3UX57_XENBS|nr:hypothetical protein XBJ1_0961 [Xenorhabdus bovienii SS-2004]CDH29815.1 hypothetical protein XBJ2_440032 [Xenorhabdus bovienii str. Jollieti]
MKGISTINVIETSNMTPGELSTNLISSDEITHYTALREHHYEYSKINQPQHFPPDLYPQQR